MLLPTILLALASPAEAYSLKMNAEGDALRWLETPVSYRINPSNRSGLDETEVETLIHGAFDQWQAVSRVPLSFDYQGETDISTPDYADKANVVFFEDEWPADWDAGFLALTFTWSVDYGEIIAFDMAINESFEWTVGGQKGKHDLYNAVTHEVGHAVGMGHSEVFDATMFADSQTGDTAKRSLAEDDAQGLRYLYSGIVAEERWMCATGGAPSSALLGLFAIAGTICLRRRDPESES
jgi:predicted Zn-dependent protease with MMP-like domain